MATTVSTRFAHPTVTAPRVSPQRRTSTQTSRAGASSATTQWNSAVTSYYALVGASTLLLILGLAMVLSSTSVISIAAGRSPYSAFLNQAQFALLGLPLMLGASRLPLHWYKRLAWPGLAFAVGLQLLTYVPALRVSAHMNNGWIRLPGIGITMQPAEVGKLALAIWLGAVLGRKHHKLGRWGHAIFPAIPGVALYAALVLMGGDMGTALVFALIAVGAFWVAGVSGKLLGLGSLGAGLIVGYFFIKTYAATYRLDRILATFSADCDITAECYQVQHGLFALGSGGIFGVGLGASREKWGLLPEAHNDFIFAIIGEELGLLGTLMVIALFVVLGWAMSRVIRRHTDPFVRITTAAIACWIVGQAFINIGVVLGVVPVTGLPLPLVSAGGSALIMVMTAIGVVISFARTEPGAAEALAARGSVVRRTVAVVSRGSRRR